LDIWVVLDGEGLVFAAELSALADDVVDCLEVEDVLYLEE